MIPAHTNPVYYPRRVAPPPVLKKQVRFVSEIELSSDDSSDTDSLCSSDTETSVTSSGSWPEHDATTSSKIVPTRPILDFRNPAFGKFFDTIDVDSPEAQRIASLDLVRFEANLQFILRTSNVIFPSSDLRHTRGHRPRPSRNETIAIARAAVELREAIRAIEPLLARMHRCGLDIKEMAKCLRTTKRVLDFLENDEADLIERGMSPAAPRSTQQPAKKPTPVNIVAPPKNASPRSHHVAQAPAPSTTSASPPTSSLARDPSPPRAVRRKPVPEAFPREQAQPTVAATPTPVPPPKSLAPTVVHTKTPPPVTPTPPKKRNQLPPVATASVASPAPAPHRAPAPLSPPQHPSITIQGPTPTNRPIALPVAYQSIPAYPSRTNVPERAPSPRVVSYKRASWPESDGRGGYVVPVSQGHITASHTARC